MIKKIFTIIIISVFFYNTASSQVLIALIFGDKLNGGRLEFGMNVGENFSTLSGIPDVTYRYGFNIGLNFIYKINNRFHLNPALFFTYPMGAKRIPIYDTPDSNLNKVLTNAEIDRKLTYFSLPVTIRYRLFGLTFIEAGASLSLSTKMNDTFTADIENENKYEREHSLAYTQNIRSEYKYFDGGVVFGITQYLRESRGVTISLKYYQGLMNISKDEKYSNQKNQVFSVIVGIPIGGTKKKNEEK